MTLLMVDVFDNFLLLLCDRSRVNGVLGLINFNWTKSCQSKLKTTKKLGSKSEYSRLLYRCVKGPFFRNHLNRNVDRSGHVEKAEK